MTRSVWSGNLSFGLVGIPVKLYPATEARDIRFHLIDPDTGRRIRYRRVVEPDGVQMGPSRDHQATDQRSSEETAPMVAASPTTRAEPEPASPRPATGAPEVEVPFEQLVRGYEVAPGEYVTLTPDEIERVRPTRSRTIEIEDFVELESIDPVYFEKSYVLGPQYGVAEKPYVLLLRALERAGRIGIGRFVLRTKPHLVAVRPMGEVLGLEALYFGDEVRDSSMIAPGVGSVTVSERELELAGQLIDMLATNWDPARYSDAYRDELLAMIAEKTPQRAEAIPAGPSGVERLMEALKESVERAKQQEKQGPRKSGRRAG